MGTSVWRTIAKLAGMAMLLVVLPAVPAVLRPPAGATVAGATGGGASLRFYGNGRNDIDRVKIRLDAPARPIDVGASDFTLEFWLKALPGENGSGACVAGGDNWIYGNIVLDRDVYGGGDYGDFGVAVAGGRIAFGVARGTVGTTICGATDVADGVWHHIALTRRASDGQLQIFVDGRLDGAGTGPTGDVSYRDGRPTSYPNDPYLVLGAEKHDAGAAYPSYSGWLDEVRISRVVRYSAAFERPSGPFMPDGETVGLYHFDEGSGDTIGDSSGATGGPSTGVRRYGGTPAGPAWSADVPWSGIGTATATQPPTVTTTRTPTSIPPATPTGTATPTVGMTTTATPTPMATPAPTGTPTATATGTAAQTPTATPVPTVTPSPTVTTTLVPTATSSPAAVPTASSTTTPSATPPATATPSVTATSPPPPPGLMAVSGRLFADANLSGAAEPGEAGLAGAVVFADLDGNGRADAGEPTSVAGSDGAYTVFGLPPGAVRICWQPGAGQTHTTPRCRMVTMEGGGPVTGVDFGTTASKSWCSGGTVMATTTGIDLAGAPEQFDHPARLPGPATGAWPGTRLQVTAAPLVYAQVGEQIATALLVAGVDPAIHPGLVLRYSYQSAYQQAVAIIAADGRIATWLPGATLPQPAPTTFTVVDRNGELYIYNVPVDGTGRYQDLAVVTLATGASNWLTTTAAIAGKVVAGQLVSIAGACGDSAILSIRGSGTLPTATPVATATATPTATPTVSGTAGTATPTATRAAALPDLRLSASDAPDPVAPGQTLTYRITVANAGTATATGGVVVEVELPPGFAFISAYGTNTFGCRTSAPGWLRCSGSTLNPGQSALLTITGRVTATTGMLIAWLAVDPDQTIMEQDDTNNTLLIETTVIGT